MNFSINLFLTFTFSSSIFAALAFQRNISTDGFLRFMHSTDFDQKTCKANDTLFSSAPTNLLQCMLLCKNDRKCLTVLHFGNQCHGCSNIYDEQTNPRINGITRYQVYQDKSICDSGWQLWSNSCYKLTQPSTFSVGQTACLKEGGTAVAIETELENNFLEGFITSVDSATYTFYIGITECAMKNVFRYVSTGEVVKFKGFHPTQPDDFGGIDECCVSFYKLLNYMWDDHPCDDPSGRTICEKDAYKI